jgi:hypothetical protein
MCRLSLHCTNSGRGRGGNAAQVCSVWPAATRPCIASNGSGLRKEFRDSWDGHLPVGTSPWKARHVKDTREREDRSSGHARLTGHTHSIGSVHVEFSREFCVDLPKMADGWRPFDAVEISRLLADPLVQTAMHSASDP